ncbi:AAA family ATPase, partial [Candidatus Woesearchaeota archaeon]|nr:AAA family ATPase [Candidatus Woesearchaeota archaeon]
MAKTIESIKNLDKLKETFDAIIEEISKVIVGQQDVVKQIIIGMLCDANVLLESYPGLGKTLMIKTLAQTMDLKFSRIQHTPDLMPSDITGTYVIEESSGKKQFKFQPGPIFANIVLADEINRATPKTQSALLEAMQEKQVTVGNDTYILEKPFFVLATQNPIEQEGSLALDQTVIINNQLKTGKELLESAQHTCIAEDEKGIRLYQLNEDAVSLDAGGKLQKHPCLLYTLPYADEMITVTTRTGKRLTVTKNHPFLTNDHGMMVWKKAEELSKEDYLVSPAKLPITPQKPVSHGEALVKIPCSMSDMPYDKDFAFWIACILSDGSVDRKGVEFWQKNYPEALDRFVSLSKGYGFNPLIKTSRGCRYVRINSRALVQYLEARFGITQGKNKEIPQSFLAFPEEMNREFLRAFIALESSLRDQRIVFTQKSASNVNIISYMLLREGILPWIRHDGRIFRLKIQGRDVPQYLTAIGWLSAGKMKNIVLGREMRSSFRVVPVHRGRILRIVELLGLNSFHTLPGRKNLVSRAWYGSYKGIKEGENVMSVDALSLFVADLKNEIRLRKSDEFRSSLEASPRHFAAGIGMPMTDVSAQPHISKNQVWKLYEHPGSTGTLQVSIREFLREAYSAC